MNYRIVDNNRTIRDAMNKYRIYQYELANIMGVHEATVCRMLRNELPKEKQDEIAELIAKSAKEMR